MEQARITAEDPAARRRAPRAHGTNALGSGATANPYDADGRLPPRPEPGARPSDNERPSANGASEAVLSPAAPR